MLPDTTYNSIAFVRSLLDAGHGELRAAARGSSKPDVMTIQNQAYVDSATKVAGKRYTVRVDYWEADANLKFIKSSIYVVIAIPETSSSAALTSNLATFRAIVAASGVLEAVTAGQI